MSSHTLDPDFFPFSITGNDGLCPVCHCVGNGSACKGNELYSPVLFSVPKASAKFLDDVENNKSLFRMNCRKFRIGRKAGDYFWFFLFHVVLHALPLRLLVKSQNDPNGLCGLKTRLFKSLHCVIACNKRTFIVDGSSAVHPASADFSTERIRLPVGKVSCGNHIKMPHNSHNFVTLTFKLNVTAVIIHVFHVEAVPPALFQGKVKGPLNLLSERRIAFSFTCNTRNCHQILQSLKHFLPVVFNNLQIVFHYY